MPDSPTDVADLAGRLRHLVESVWSRFETLNAPDSAMARACLGLHSLAIEHACAIAVLMETGLPAPAFALMRPMDDAYMRAFWVHHCADGARLKAAVLNDKFPGTGTIFKDLAAVPSVQAHAAEFGKFHEEISDRFHSFTHGGRAQLEDRIVGLVVQHAPTGDLQRAAIRLAAAYVMLTVSDAAALACKGDLAAECFQLFTKLGLDK